MADDNVIWGIDFRSGKQAVPPEFADFEALVQTGHLKHEPKIEHWSTRVFWHGPFEPDGAA